MQYRSGIYIKQAFPRLAEELADRLPRHGFQVSGPSDIPGSLPNGSSLELTVSSVGGDWSCLRIDGNTDHFSSLTDCLSMEFQMFEIFRCLFEPGRNTYFYTYSKSGKVLEDFSSRGAGMGEVSFSSDLRSVPLQEILNPRKFMEDAMALLGIAVQRPDDKEKEHRLFLSPGKKRFF